MARPDPIRIDGLVQLQRSLRQVGSDAPKALRETHNKAGAMIVDWARPRIPTKTGRAAASVRTTSGQRDARVTGGGARVPWYPWLDFGGRVGRGKSVARPFRPGGRYIYAGYTARRDDIEAELLAGLTGIVERAGLEVSG